MATDEEYLDNLLKAAMEEDDRLHGNDFSDAGAVDEDEEWKNSLDEMLASVNAAENDMDGDIALTDADFSDFTDIMDESGEDYQEIGEDELDVMDLGLSDLGLDIMDDETSMEEASDDLDMSQTAMNDLMYIAHNMDDKSENLQDEYATHEASAQEGQEADQGKSRKELQEEKKEQKRLAKEQKKEQKRLAKEEKRMAKERQKDAKKAEKESQKEAKKAGAFSSFIDFLTEEIEDEEDSKAGAEGGDDGTAGEEGIEAKGSSGKKGKKDKKKKKGKKEKEQGEGEEGSEGEEAADPKKAAKQAKKAMKEQKKREKAEEKANQPRVKVLSRKMFLVLVAFCATIVAAVVFLSVFLSDYVEKTRARQAFNSGDYNEAYILLYGKDLNSGDQVIYHRVSMLLRLERKLEVYERYMNDGEVARALDILLQGVAQYNEIVQQDTYGAGNELREVYLRILDTLSQQYGIGEEDALELLSSDDTTYSRRIYEITLGVDFGVPGSTSNEPQPPQDVLPEEEDIINMEVTGE